uniref:ELM2 and Myb/SANT-like domain containing 1 n=1 Tax=Nothobranchius kuhntae TaxID=321403 RepID=A0A1A8IEY9_NOTKU
MESLPAKVVKTEDGASCRQASITPLVIPVSVPVQGGQAEAVAGWSQARLGAGERPAGPADRKPSVIVARRRSQKYTVAGSFSQDEDNDPGQDEDGKSKFKRRTRPEPLIIPLPKPSTLIPASVYSSITPYQSNLRSPVRMPDNPHAPPPYTPPPILSPIRVGTGLYFSAFLTNIAVSNQILPPPPPPPPAATPKSATCSLLRSSQSSVSSDITPPVLPLISDATPVCLEPRINIGQQYQAEIPDLQQLPSSQFDQHKADLVWLPSDASDFNPGARDSIEDLMNMACSSVLSGGGTNQELVLHCLHECGGKILETLERLMLQDSVFPRGHHLEGYHYSGSDSWSAEEKCYFNKGISAYRKDFFLVQKLVRTKTVAQCVEFYYTYKKHVKIGRSGTLIYGETEPLESRVAEEELDHKGSQRLEPQQEEDSRKWEGSADRKQDVCPIRVTHTLPSTENTVLIMKSRDDIGREQPLSRVIHQPPPPPPSSKSRFDGSTRKTSPSTGNKTSVAQEGEFPCKKCGRIFYKVKSRSAHMKSHAEQEKKAAALRQKEAEERAAAKAAAEAAAFLAARQHNGTRQLGGDSTNDDSSDGEDEDWRH